jgi:uncharacterized membrane protein
MPDIGPFHPQVVHFVVACLFVGLPVYWLSFLKRPRFLRPMATVLLVVGTGAAFVAVESGTDAHGLAERIPGARSAVQEHEELGIHTRNIFAGILLLELIALGVAWRAGGAGSSVLSVEAGEAGAAGASTKRFAATALSGVVAVAWTVGAFQLFETADHGGDVVYDYAGGVGFRRGGDPQDVSRLLLAGLFGEAQIDRQEGRHDDAARLIEEMVQRYPDNADVQLLGVQSMVVDRKDGRAALDRLATLKLPDDPRAQLQRQTYAFDAYMLMGMPDSARAALDAVPERYRNSRMVSERRAQLGS